MLGASYEDAVKAHKEEKRARSAARAANPDNPSAAARAVPTPFDDARQAGKVANFGFPGGLGAKKLVLFARKTYKVSLTEDRAKWLKGVWLETFPEWRRYFKLIDSWRGPDGLITLRHLFSNRIRGGANYCAACNSLFQGLGADATGAAWFAVVEACYAGGPCRACGGSKYTGASDPDPWGPCPWCKETGITPLFGARCVNYVHDEFILECEENTGHEIAHELVRLMIEGAAPYLPGVPPKAKPVLMRYWSKDAEQVWENGRLMPWPK
jgi:DNA polymerase-1